MYQTIGFIGTGNMGAAMARAAAKSGLAEVILLSNRTPASARRTGSPSTRRRSCLGRFCPPMRRSPALPGLSSWALSPR